MSEGNFHLFGAFALEITPTAPTSATLSQQQAGELAAAIANDLYAFDAKTADLELIIAGAHYDPVELLRPGWPIHAELEQLAARAPKATPEQGSGRIIAFGHHQDKMPGILTPDEEYQGGAMRLLPWVLSGNEQQIHAIGNTLESELMERGMASAKTALLAQSMFGLKVEHARLLTLFDLCAMMALQYEHAGLEPLWPVLETALFAPEKSLLLDAPPEPLLHYTEKEAKLAMFSPLTWCEHYNPDAMCEETSDEDRIDRGFRQFEARQRQYVAVLQAHGIMVNLVQYEQDWV